MKFAKTLNRDEMKSIMAGRLAGECVHFSGACPYNCCTWLGGGEVNCPCSACCVAI